MQNIYRKKLIQQGFDTVAAGYDHPSLPFFPETAKRLIEHLNLNPTDNLLEVCTGTGVVALDAPEKLTQDTSTGIDLSSGIPQQAKNKAIKKGLYNTEFQQMYFEHLIYEEDLRNVPFNSEWTSYGLFISRKYPLVREG